MPSGFEPYKIEVRAEPLTLRLHGVMRTDEDSSEISGVSERGALVESTKSCLIMVNEGTFTNEDTGEIGDLDPGLYMLSSDGLFMVGDDD